MQTIEKFNQDLLNFLKVSPTPFHATKEIARKLLDAGFIQLIEADVWELKNGSGYFVIRNGSSITAFVKSDNLIVDSGFRMVGAHTDSPCLKVKPAPEIKTKGYFQLGVEVYGGALLNPWFDRDLSLAGRVVFKTGQGQLKSELIDYQRAIANIPSLAIHLDREANKDRTVNPQKHIAPILMQTESDSSDFRTLLLDQVLAEHPECNAIQVIDYELSFYDVQPAALIGLNQDFISSARLDNLLSCYIGLQSTIDSYRKVQKGGTAQNCLLVCNDHEEVGSMSASGAQGPMLKSILRRILNNESDFVRAMANSMMISADNAHGVHPNYVDKHDDNHGPLLNRGPVIKVNANQRYATDSETSALFRQLCEHVGEPVQSFVTRTDMACGSTIGPITASELGVKTLDIGVPTFAMHSIREMAGSKDAYSLYRVLIEFNSQSCVTVN